jgi:multimeric flavodoxin WrbA/putative sterol carrier protein
MVLEGVRRAGAEVEEINACAARITPCIGCYHCWTVTPGVCIHKDDMPDILEKILEADLLLFATPVYYYTVSSAIKTFLERTLPLTKQGFEFTPKGCMRNRTRYPERWKDKKLAYVAAAALKKPENFDGIRQTFDLLADGFNLQFAGGIVRPEAYLLQFSLAKPKTVKTVETALVQAGREMVTDGKVSAATAEKTALPLAVDMEHFFKYSTIYWQHAVSMGAEAADLDKVQRAVVTDVRILMSEMARSVDKSATAKLKLIFQFDFTDTDQHFRLEVDHGECTMKETASEHCDLRVIVTTETWAKVFMREINVRDALVKGDIKLQGDKFLFSRLDRFFPPPVS